MLIPAANLEKYGSTLQTLKPEVETTSGLGLLQTISSKDLWTISNEISPSSPFWSISRLYDKAREQSFNDWERTGIVSIRKGAGMKVRLRHTPLSSEMILESTIAIISFKQFAKSLNFTKKWTFEWLHTCCLGRFRTPFDQRTVEFHYEIMQASSKAQINLFIAVIGAVQQNIWIIFSTTKTKSRETFLQKLRR